MSTANLLLRLKADADQAIREMQKVEGAQEKLGEGAKRAGLAAGVALGALAVQGVRAFADLDTGMREVFTLMPGISAQSMQQMTDDVRAFAVEYGVATDEVVPALYQAISAGVPADNVLTFMATAAQTARGGVTDMATSVNALSTLVNAYGSDVMSAGDASDILFTAMRLGKTTIGELSDSLFQVVPVAASTGVSFDQVAAALVTMSMQGTPTRVAATNLRGALVELGKEGTIAFKAFEEAAGQTFPEFVASGGDIGQAFNLMSESAVSNGTTIQNQFGSIEGGMAATVIASQTGADTFAGAMDQMGQRAGATGDAFDMMAGGIGFSFDQLKATFQDMMMEVGESLMPAVEALVPVFEELIPPIAAVIAPLAEGLLPVVVALLPLLESMGPLAVSAGELFVAAAPLFIVMAEALIPVAETVEGLVEGLTWMIDTFNGLDPAAKEVEASTLALGAAFTGLREGIRESDADKITGFYVEMADVMGVSVEQARTYYAELVSNVEREIEIEDRLAGNRREDVWRHTAAVERLTGVEGGLVGMLGQAAAAAEAATGPERALAAALEWTAVSATAVWEAEQQLANLRRAALDPVFAAIQAEADLITTSAEVVRLEAEKKTGTDEYRLALLEQLQAQADLDAAHGKLKASTGIALGAIVSLGAKLGWTAEQTQTLTGWVTEFNETTPEAFNAQTAVEGLAEQMGIAYTDALDLALALGAIDGQTYRFLIEGTYQGPSGLGGRWVYNEATDAMEWGGPRAASGGFISSSKMTLVGEEGPELVSLPGGSTVWPHGTGPAGGGGSSVTVNVGGSVLTENSLVDLVESAVIRMMGRGGRSNMLVAP